MKLNILLIGGFLIVALMCGIVGLVATDTFLKVEKINAELQEDIVPNVIEIVEMKKSVYNVYAKGMEYIIHRRHKKNAAAIKAEMKKAMDELKELGDKHFEHKRYLGTEKRKNVQQLLDKIVTFNYAISGIIDFIEAQVEDTEQIDQKIAEIENRTVNSAYRILADHLMEHKMAHIQELEDANITVTEAHISSRNTIIITTLIIIILAITIGLAISRSVKGQIDELKEKAREIGEGNLDIRIKIKSKNEIGELAASFNQMADDLKLSSEAEKEKTKELQQLKDELEIKVSERTNELNEKVQKLNRSQRAMLYMVDDLNKTSKELKKERVELEASNNELEAFAYSVSHDLRAPLRSIDGFSQVLLENYTAKLDENGKHYLERVRAASQRMGKLIDDLLMLSRITRKEMRWEKVDLSELAKQVSSELQEHNTERKVEFNIAEGHKVNGDGVLLRTLIENLLGNAWKFTKEKDKPKISFGVVKKQGKKCYFIKDNGAGFEMKYANKLFKPFQRLHSEQEFAGTGIGLANVYRIIRRHGGSVWAESDGEGKGAIFYFTIEF